MKTQTVNPESVERKWWILDAKDMVLGRLASTAAHLLIGKHKASYSPLHDHGDHVIIVNADHVRLTGKKQETKRYFSHSQKPGGWRNLSIAEVEAVRPGASMEAAIKGMLPKNPRGRAIASKLHIYQGDQHPHAAQKPETLALKAA